MSIFQFNNRSLFQCVLVLLLLPSIGILHIASHHDSYGSAYPCNKDHSPALVTSKSKTSTSGIDSFAFNYSKSGGLRPTYERICYSSDDGLIIKKNNNPVIKKQLSGSEINDLKQKFSNNVFYLNIYKPHPGSADYYNYTLTV